MSQSTMYIILQLMQKLNEKTGKDVIKDVRIN